MAWCFYNVMYRIGSAVYGEIVNAQSEYEAMRLVESKHPGAVAQSCKKMS